MGFGKIFATKLPIVEQDKLIARLTDTLLKIAKPSKVLLFGSAARREMTSASDLDIIVIVESSGEVKPTQKALSQLSRLLEWPVDVLVIDREQFKRRSALGGVYAVANDEGIVLFS